jgi:hypothetical protein
VDALLDAKPAHAEPWFSLPFPWAASHRSPEREATVFLTMIVFLGVVMLTCLFGVAVIPRFDRRPPLGPLHRARATASRSLPARSA